MDSVALTKLYLEYPQSTTVKVTKTMQLAESMYGHNSVEYHQYVEKYTEPSEKKLVEAINAQMFLEDGREYMGVTIYSNDNGTYSVPELGIYNIEDAKNVKDAVRTKLSQVTRPKSVNEDAEYVIDNIFEIANITDTQFVNFVLNEMTESDYIGLGGTNFKNFVLLISEVVEQEWEMPTSMITENYMFDEGIGDFVKKVKGGISDAHLNLAYAAPGLAGALGDAYTRHTSAVNGAKKKLGDISATTAASANDAKNKIKGAVGRTINKDNLRMGARIAGAVAVAAGKGLYNTADAVATGIGNAAATGAAVASLTDKESRKKGFSTTVPAVTALKVATAPKVATATRSKSDAANDILDKLRIDGNAEKASSVTSTKRMTSKEKEKEYDEYIKSLKEDLDSQLEFIKYWLAENDIFENDEDIDNYILNEMDKEEYIFILDEADEDLIRKFVNNAKPRSVKGDSSKTRVANKQTGASMDAAYKKHKKTQDLIDAPVTLLKSTPKSLLGKAISPPQAVPTPLGKAIDNPYNSAYKNAIASLHEPANKEKNYNPNGSMLKRSNSEKSMSALSNAHQNGYSIYTGSKQPNVSNSEKSMSALSSAYQNGYSIYTGSKQPNVSNSEKSMSALSNAHENGYSIYTGNKKPKTPMSPLTTDNLTTRGKSYNTKQSPVQDKFTSSLKNVFGSKKVKPSSLISTAGSKAKKLAGHAVSSIKKRLFGESLLESDIKNWIEEEQFYQVTEWLIENDIFEDDDELMDYLYEGLNWEDLESINHDIEQRALELIIESLCNEETYDSTFVVLESLLGDEFIELLETMTSDSDTYEPMPIVVKDCSCKKPTCKACSKKSWKSKVYDKMLGDK